MTLRRETTRRERLARNTNVLAAVLLLAWILYDGTGQTLFGRRPWPDSVVDYRILYEMSRKVVHDKRYEYPPIFPYPPSAVVLLYATTSPPFPVAAGVWLAFTLLATAGTVVLGTSLIRLPNQSWRWLAALVAFALTDYFIQWDLRSQNCNMVYLFLLVAALAALQRKHNTLAGVLLGASIALKLYPALVVPYLWWIGKRRAFAASTGFLVVFFVVLPLAVFGLSHVVPTYASWIEQLRFIGATVNVSKHPILIALPFTLAKHFGAESSFVSWLLRGASAIWLVAVAACVLAGRPWRNDRTDGWNLAVDGGILALAPVVISPYLEPYHTVPALLPILALVQRATDSSHTTVSRVVAVVALATGWLALHMSGGLDFRGIGVWVQMLLVALALTAVRLMEPHPPPYLPGPSLYAVGEDSRNSGAIG